MKKNSGYLLLECMVAMVIIVTSLLFLMGTITFFLVDEKKAQEELEQAILLYEMSSVLNDENAKQQVGEKAVGQKTTIEVWNENHLRIECDDKYLEIKKY
ncbi:type II secretion system protein [Vagococcus carniphilus]|uniref:Type II secretion system protein n=1 Tax=Vagococcus carniphilus TaxID=218144 RepID=A0A430B440_9ENTE|nr:type II secretion system protein [Vagococcus carniphilus]QNN73479.1 type II secretion system protein [Vagococcus carniphilus]RSU14972.1 hypothetical protein CBF28_07840 [Vagococcus carniphilus]